MIRPADRPAVSVNLARLPSLGGKDAHELVNRLRWLRDKAAAERLSAQAEYWNEHLCALVDAMRAEVDFLDDLEAQLAAQFMTLTDAFLDVPDDAPDDNGEDD